MLLCCYQVFVVEEREKEEQEQEEQEKNSQTGLSSLENFVFFGLEFGTIDFALDSERDVLFL